MIEKEKDIYLLKKTTKGAGLFDKPSVQAELLDTNRILITFPSVMGTKPSVVIDRVSLQRVADMLWMGQTERDKIDYLTKMLDKEFVGDILAAICAYRDSNQVEEA